MNAITPEDMKESLNRLLNSHACKFAEWVDRNLYTQDDKGMWYCFPTHEEYKLKTTGELYELFLIEQQ